MRVFDFAGPSPMTRSRLPALLLVSTLLLAACADEAPPAEATPSLTVSVAAPVQQSLPQRVAASGSVAAWEQMALGVELSGQRVAEVLVEVGDVVKKGQPLLQLDDRSLRMELRQAEAVLAQADASLAVASANARRGERLKREQLIADSEADQLISGELTARAQRQTAQAQLENARLRLGFATLRAPDDGVISQRLVQPGRVVSAGAELLTLIRDGRLEWRAELPERDLIRVVPGVAVELRGPDGAAVAGTVRAVSPALDAQSRTGVVYADLPAPGALRAGMYAQGDLVLGDLPARTVPDQAIVERDGYRYVFVLGDGDVVSQRRVELGVREGGVVQVREGLEADERVVVEGAGFLADGDRVRVVAATGG
jgi:RND family efflux transporter MFP subunit